MNDTDSIDTNGLTRREALLSVIQGTAVVAALSMPTISHADEQSIESSRDFVVENDYPFFGPEPECNE